MAAFPTLTNGVDSQYPYLESDVWNVTEQSVPAGISYTWTDQAALLRCWTLQYPSITRADKVILENFWIQQRGPWLPFTFTDDQSVSWNPCRFDMDVLAIQHIGPNQYSTVIKIVAIPS